MKKLCLILIAVILSVPLTNAQHYRGFLDFTASVPFTKFPDGFKYDGGDAGISIGGTTSHGIQLKNFFIGAGIGVLAIPSGYGCGLPVFVDGRYDFFGVSKANLFIACKLGCMPWVYDNEAIELVKDNVSTTTIYGKLSGLYFNPSVGIRFRLSDILGINIAISYLPLTFECTETYFNDLKRYIGDKFSDHRLAISVGLDF